MVRCCSECVHYERWYEGKLLIEECFKENFTVFHESAARTCDSYKCECEDDFD